MSVSSYGVTVTIEVGFDDGPFTPLGSVSWTDLTAHVRAWSTNGGRSSELATYSPRMATVVFNNRARLFDSANTSGTYYGKLKPRRPLRITLTVGVTSWVIFTGYTRGWELSYPGTTDAVCTVACTDAFDVLAGARLPGSAYGAAVLADSPAYYWPLQELNETDGFTPALVGGVDAYGPGNATRLGIVSSGSTSHPVGESNGVQNGISDANFTAMALPAAVEFWAVVDPDSGIWPTLIVASSGTSYTTGVGVQLVQTDATTAPFLNVAYTNASANKRTIATSGYYSAVTLPAPATSATHIAVTFTTSTATVYVNGEQVGAVSTETGTHTITTGLGSPGVRWLLNADTEGDSLMSHVAVYSSAPSASRILAHYEAGTIAHGHPMGEAAGARIGRILDSVGWASADRNLSAGVTVLGPWVPGTYALNDIRALETVEQGLFFIAGDGKATFRDRTDQWTTARMVTAQATFGDGVGETPLANPLRIDGNSIDYVRNSADVSYSSATITVKDDTSVAAYGEEPESIDASTLPDTAGWIARQLANYRVRLHKDPATRIPSVPIGLHEADGADTHVATVAALALGDRVAVNRRPDGSTDPISLACRLEGFRWSWDPNGFDWTGYLAPCPPSAADGDYFVVGSSLVGGTDTTPY